MNYDILFNGEILEVNELKSELQSTFGVYSFFVGIFNLVYAFLVGLDIRGGGENFFKPLLNMMPDKGGSGETGTGLIIIFVFFLLIPAVGNLLGLIFGIIGANQKEYRRSLAFIGIVMCLVIPVAALIVYFYIITCAGCKTVS